MGVLTLFCERRCPDDSARRPLFKSLSATKQKLTTQDRSALADVQADDNLELALKQVPERHLPARTMETDVQEEE